MVTGIDPGVESGESVARTVTARAVMPNQGPPAARRAVRGVGADELNRHGKRGVDRGGRIQPADALSHQYAYSTSGSQSARRRHVVGPVRASTPGEYRQASLLSWTRKLASRSDEFGLLRGLGHRDDADLLHQCEMVPERPGLDDLAVPEIAGDDTGDVALLARSVFGSRARCSSLSLAGKAPPRATTLGCRDPTTLGDVLPRVVGRCANTRMLRADVVLVD